MNFIQLFETLQQNPDSLSLSCYSKTRLVQGVKHLNKHTDPEGRYRVAVAMCTTIPTVLLKNLYDGITTKSFITELQVLILNGTITVSEEYLDTAVGYDGNVIDTADALPRLTKKTNAVFTALSKCDGDDLQGMHEALGYYLQHRTSAVDGSII